MSQLAYLPDRLRPLNYPGVTSGWGGYGEFLKRPKKQLMWSPYQDEECLVVTNSSINLYTAKQGRCLPSWL